MVRRPAPERAVLPVEEDGVDGARGALLELEPVTHVAQVAAHPGITPGIHPPDGVPDTTQPEVAAASMDAVPRVNAASNAASAAPSSSCCSVWLPPPDVVGVRAGGGGGQPRSRSRYGFVPPWKG